MGHLVNPITYRVGVSRFWNNTWNTSNKNLYNVLSTQDIQINNFLNKLLSHASQFFYKGIIFWSVKLVRINKDLNIIIYTKIPGLSNVRRSIKYLTQATKPTPAQQTSRMKINKPHHASSTRSFKVVEKKISLNSFEKFLRTTKRSPRFTTEYSFADVNAIYNKQILQISKMARLYQTNPTPCGAELVRFVMYKILFKGLRTYLMSGLKRFFKSHPLGTISTLFVCSSPISANAEFVARYVATRLRNRVPINRLINLVLSQMTRLLNSAQIVGFKIACSGRFERRGRASYVWEQCGKVAAGNLNLKVDYSLKLVTLTNSICGIKVWITKSRQSNKLFII